MAYISGITASYVGNVANKKIPWEIVFCRMRIQKLLAII